MNPLDAYPELRKYLYMFQWVVNAVVTVAGAVFLIQGTSMDDLPEWYVLTVGVAPVLWTVLGITAQTNVTPALPAPADPEQPMYPETPPESTPPPSA